MELDINTMKKNSLNLEIWKYLVLFSVIILAFIWFFQILFLNKFYEYQKTKDIENIAEKIAKESNTSNIKNIMDEELFRQNVCIEVTDSSGVLYSSGYSKGCLRENEASQYKKDFIYSNKSKMKYQLLNPVFHNKTLVYALKKNNKYIFVNTSIEPIDQTITILKDQFIYVTILVFILSFIIAYFISRHISKPIIKINNSAKKLAEKDYNVVFSSSSSIEEIVELEKTLNNARDELCKTEELRTELMANISHDLKTPLTMIKAYAEMSRDLHSNNKKKREENLNIIIEEADRLTLLVNDILTLSKMQQNMEKLNYTSFSLNNLIKDILNRYQIYKETENYNFVLLMDKEVVIVADKKKIEQVIYNLVNNAISYTGSDKKVIVKLIDKESSTRVEITDTGKGIDEDELPYIWDKYYRSEKKHKRNVIGTGIGLSIVKEVLILHRYQFGVESKKNKGTTFYFEIQKPSLK